MTELRSETQRLRDKRVWITGASRGIGRALAEALAAQGAHLVLSARSADELHSLAKSLAERSRVRALPCDLGRADDVAAAAAIAAEQGDIDILINNAGMGVFKPLTELSIDEFDAMMNINMRAAFLCTRAVLPAMLSNRAGTIVNINSVAAQTAFQGCTAYGASKAALLAFSRSLRAEVREQGIKVLDMIPGATATSIWSEEALAQHGEVMMQAADLAGLAVDLLSGNPRMMIEEIVIRPQNGDL